MSLLRSVRNRISRLRYRNSNLERDGENFDGLITRYIEILTDNGTLGVTNEQIPEVVNRIREVVRGSPVSSTASYMLVYSIITASVEPHLRNVVYLPWYTDVKQHVQLDEKCAICWNEIGCDVKCKRCVNYFHKECVEPHRLSKDRCPVCRHEVVDES